MHTRLNRSIRNQVYIIDKTENNPIQVNGHPAWATGEPLVPFLAHPFLAHLLHRHPTPSARNTRRDATRVRFGASLQSSNRYLAMI